MIKNNLRKVYITIGATLTMPSISVKFGASLLSRSMRRESEKGLSHAEIDLFNVCEG